LEEHLFDSREVDGGGQEAIGVLMRVGSPSGMIRS
jgi:hypothetical protein